MRRSIHTSIIAVLWLLSCGTLCAQTALWGLTSTGGANGGGAIVKVNTDGSSFSTAYSFQNGGREPYGELLAASNGNYYGMTTVGGTNNLGALYEYNPTTSAYTIKHQFAASTGSKAFGGLVEYNSKYYGMTSAGGTSGAGVIFEYDPAAATYTVRHNLATSTGSSPIGSLTLYNSKLYGVCAEGGTNSGGVIFELNPTGWVYTVKHNFVLATGFAPYSTLAIYNSKLYGSTSEGGANNLGALYEYDPSANTYTLKYSFVNATGGAYPSGSLAVSGTSLYGVAMYGGANLAGTLFQYDVSTSTFTLRYSFPSALTGVGRRPRGGLLIYNSKLYGTTQEGGSNGVGALYEYDPTASAYTVKYNFASGTGYMPMSDLMQTGGILYGTALSGGTHGYGIVYEYNVSTAAFVVKHSFGSATGENPFGSLIEHNSKYYGVTNLGGTGGGGVLFEIDPATNAYTVKYNFATATGKNPHGSLVLLNSKFYGVASAGGANGLGALFEFDPATTTYTLKYSFGPTTTTFTSGFRPEGTLVAYNGSLYGMALYGGSTASSTTLNGGGVIFEYNPTSSTYTVRYNFATGTTTGSSPDGGALLVYNNLLYGLTFHNGTVGDGTLFEFNPSTSAYTVKHNFTGTAGGFPFGGLLQYNGVLYGTTGYGGTNNLGALFSYNLTSSTYANLYSFASASGSLPECTLLQTGGMFYGTTYSGGTNGYGTLFQFNPTGNAYSVLRSLAQTDGANPMGDLLPGTASSCTLTASASGTNVSCFGGSTGTATATPTGGTSPYTYLWSNSATTQAISGLAAGTYSVVVTDANLCTTSASVTVTQPALLTASASGTSVACFGGSNGTATATPSGGTAPYTYLWSNSATTQTISGLAAGTYTVVVTDANLCTTSASVTVTQAALLTASASGTNVSCFGGSNGTATATPSGGTAPYTYLWSNAATTQTINGLTAGTYNVVVTGTGGCTASASVTIAQPASALSASASGTNVSCFGGSNGTATVTPSGGTSPYTYLWSNSATTQSISGLAAGTYNVTVTATGGCTSSASVTLTQPAVFVANASGTNVSCFGGSNGTATATPSGGTAPYTYLWSNSATTQTISGLAAGTHTVTVTATGGCTSSASVTLTQPALLSVSVSGVNPSSGNNGSATATPSGGTAPYTYAWSNGGTTQTISGLAAGAYTVTVTGTGGCIASGSVTLVSSTMKFENGVLSGVGDACMTVNLTNIYTSMVVVATLIQPNTSSVALVTRVQNASGSSFQVRVQKAKYSGMTTAATVHWIVAEEGTYTTAAHGVKFEAKKFTPTVTSRAGNWVFTQRTYSNAYTTPVVVGQVMTFNDANWSVFWASRHNSLANPPSATSFSAGKHIAEDNVNLTRADETIGYMVFESGTGFILGKKYRAALGSDIVRGTSNSSTGYSYTISGLTTLQTAVVSSAAMDGTEGAWGVMAAPPTNSLLRTWALEDDILDAERSHTTEQMAWFAIGTGTALNYPEEEAVSDWQFFPERGALSAYPNPASTELTVEFEQTESSATLLVLDALGKVVLREQFDAAEQGERQTTLEVSLLRSGCYFLHLLDGKRERRTVVFVKE